MSTSTARAIFLTILAVVAIATWYPVSSASPSYLSVRVLDVGQGDAIHIQTPDGVEMLIDGGADTSVLREVARAYPVMCR